VARTNRDHTKVMVESLPNCDIKEEHPTPVKARYDAKTIYGPWANLCQHHFEVVAIGNLGLGKGQRLVLKNGK